MISFVDRSIVGSTVRLFVRPFVGSLDVVRLFVQGMLIFVLIVFLFMIHTCNCSRTLVRFMMFYNEARPRERSDRGRFLPSGKKTSS